MQLAEGGSERDDKNLVAELIGDSVAVVESTYSHVIRTKHEVASVASGLIR